MTILPPQAERDSIGIDTYERAILYAASMLRRSFLVDGEKANLKRLSITTAQSKENNNILIEGEFPYSNSTTWEKGGDVFKPVWYLSLSDPSNSFSPPSNLLPFGNPYIALPNDPSWVATLEEYFIWVLSQSKVSLHLESPPRHDVISYRFFDGRSPDPVVEVKASLPFDLDIWLRDRHFFNALLPLLKYSPAIRAIEVGEFTRKAVIESTDTKVRIIGNPLFPDGFITRESTFEVSSKYFKIFRNPVVEFTREGVFSSEGARFIPDFSEFVREAIIAVTENYVGFAEYTRDSVFDVTLDKKNPIIEQSDFTRETVLDVSSNTEGSSALPTYNSIVPITIPASSISKNHFNFVVYVKLEDIDFKIDLSSKTEAQQLEFYNSIRVKAPVGNELPTYVRGRYENSNAGYLFFLAPFLSASQDNVFFINFDSSTVTSNPDEKQVFQDYWWVSLAVFVDLNNPLYNDDSNWNENQSPSNLSNNVSLGINAVRTQLNTSRELPLNKAVNAETLQNQNSAIETPSISFNDNPTLTIWTSQGIDSLVKLSNLGFNTRTEIGIIEDIDEANNEFIINFWESKFDDGEIVFFGYFATGNEDGTLVSSAGLTFEGNFTITRVGTDRFEIGSAFLETRNDAPYNGTAEVNGLEVIEVNTLMNNVKIKYGDQFLSDGQSVNVGLNHSGKSDGSITNNALSSPDEAGMPRMVGYGSALNNQDTNISENFKYTISKVDQNKFKLISVQDNTEFNIGTVNNANYNGISRIVGNIDLQTTLPDERLGDFVNFNKFQAMRRYDRTVNDAYLNGNGQGSDTLTSVLNGTLNARLYNDSVVSYIKLAKYTKSQLRIIDEYNNETNPTNFYQVGTAKEISEFTRETIYEVTEKLPYKKTVLVKNPIAYYTLDGNDPNNVIEETGSGYDLSLNGGTITTGQPSLINSGNSFDFNDSGRLVNFDFDEVNNLNNDFSFVVWVKFKSLSVGVDGILSNGEWTFRWNGYSDVLEISDNNTEPQYSFVPSLDTVYCFAFTASSSEGKKLYANGTLDTSTSNTNNFPSGYRIYLGREHQSGSRTVDALIDEVQIYDYVLTAQDVSQLYQSGV